MASPHRAPVRPHRLAARPFTAGVAELLRTRAFAIVWAAYVAGNVADCVTTQIALRSGLRERNPLAAGVYAHGGIAGLWALKAAVVGLVLLGLTLVPRRLALLLAGALAVTMALNVNANLDALRSIGL